MTAHELIEALAGELGIEAPSEAEFSQLLELAAVAAHGSERIAAPIACWMAGVAGRAALEVRELAEGIVARGEG